ncbi:response regulator transcription factor [Pseudomonas sp. Irchel 3E20]|uniref:response regulator transcription factor n=1 Tax=Pseudomonas sp. Irchel 3E20 TaxID=2008983 RepID=UPI001C470CC9|nr:helix-turn-helix transcriptional regulator [Pseudomonas sp. Irchel 3E20]
MAEAVTPSPRHPGLSRREREVALHICQGLTSKEIGQLLGISDLTVRKHRENLYRKLAISSIGQLVLYCLQQKWIYPATN